MTAKKQDHTLTSVRLPTILIQKLHFYQKIYKEKHGFEISLSSLYRTFLEEGLTSRGITNNVFESSSLKESSKEEST